MIDKKRVIAVDRFWIDFIWRALVKKSAVFLLGLEAQSTDPFGSDSANFPELVYTFPDLASIFPNFDLCLVHTLLKIPRAYKKLYENEKKKSRDQKTSIANVWNER